MTPHTIWCATSKGVGIVAMAFLATGPPASAQWLDPDRCITCPDKLQHFAAGVGLDLLARGPWVDRKSTRLNSSHSQISYAVFCLKKKKTELSTCIRQL